MLQLQKQKCELRECNVRGKFGESNFGLERDLRLMSLVNSKEIDFMNPVDVLCKFFAEMNQWETEAWNLHKQSKDIEQENIWFQIQAGWKPVFEKFCTKRKRVYGQHRSIGKPPAYNV